MDVVEASNNAALRAAYAKLAKGTRFISKEQVQEAVSEIAVRFGVNHIVKATDSRTYRVRCDNKAWTKQQQQRKHPSTCAYAIHANKQTVSGAWEITEACWLAQDSEHELGRRRVRPQTLARFDRTMIGNPAAQVQQVSARYGLTMSGSQMAEYAAQAQGRTHVKRQEEFDRLHSFVQWINANGHHAAHLMTKDGAFSELLFCLKLNGLSAKSPKVLFTDATHLSYNNMMLHLLCQLDADNKIFILGANITQQ
ncbi:hypothetical protein PTSG_12977, partial [Salpingoeca rosetta]